MTTGNMTRTMHNRRVHLETDGAMKRVEVSLVCLQVVVVTTAVVSRATAVGTEMNGVQDGHCRIERRRASGSSHDRLEHVMRRVDEIKIWDDNCV